MQSVTRQDLVGLCEKATPEVSFYRESHMHGEAHVAHAFLRLSPHV